MEEILEKREYTRMPRSINRHSMRYFNHRGRLFLLDRTTDAIPPFFTFSIVPQYGICTAIKVQGQEYWGDGISWPKALKLAEAALNDKATIDQHGVPLHRRFHWA